MIRTIRNIAVAFVVALMVIGLGVLAAFVTLNWVEVYPSFWLGSLGIAGLVIVYSAFFWASRPETGDIGGTILGATVATAMMVAGALWHPFDGFSFPDFGRGLGALAIVAVTTAIVWFYGRIFRQADEI